MSMHQPICWADLAGARVGVWGLGREGIASLRRLRSLGVDPVVVNDTVPADSGETVVATDDGGLDALLACEVVIKTPGISRHRSEVATLTAAGIPVVGGLGLWLAGVDRERVVCITGTKGKSTTTAIAAHLAQGLGVDAVAGGNLGPIPWDLDAPADPALWLIEVSSYQAADTMVSPPLVAVTSLDPDHLPWHGSEDQYYADKLSLCTKPGSRTTIASSASARLREHVGQLGNDVRWAGSADPQWADALGMVGAHNAMNAEIARMCLELAGVDGADDVDRLRQAAAGFEGLTARLQLVATVDGVDFYDDTLSTNVLPTLAAVEAFAGRPIALIVGGLDRAIDYGPLAQGLADRHTATLVLAGHQTGAKIRKAFDGVTNPDLTVVAYEDLPAAVEAAAAWAPAGGVVLLSPAAASFDAFDDYAHKGRVFLEAILSLTQNSEARP